MSLKVVVTDEQTGETETMRIAKGGFTVVAASPCAVYEYSEVTKDGKMIIKIKNFNPQPLEDVS